MKDIFVFGVVIITLAACSVVPRLIVMQNPKTGEVAQCRHDVQDALNSDDIRNCVEGYKKAGWKQLTPDQDASFHTNSSPGDK